MSDPVTAITAVGTLLGGVASAKQAFAKPPKPAAIPEPKEPTVSPVPDDRAADAARRRRLATIRNRSGRQSTFLSDFGRNESLG